MIEESMLPSILEMQKMGSSEREMNSEVGNDFYKCHFTLHSSKFSPAVG